MFTLLSHLYPTIKTQLSIKKLNACHSSHSSFHKDYAEIQTAYCCYNNDKKEMSKYYLLYCYCNERQDNIN